MEWGKLRLAPNLEPIEKGCLALHHKQDEKKLQTGKITVIPPYEGQIFFVHLSVSESLTVAK